MKKNILLSSLIILMLIVGFIYDAYSYKVYAEADINRQVKNLKVFAKVYGYVKYFYPSDEAVDIDWDKFALEGIQRIVNCPDNDCLIRELKNVFNPIAPLLNFINSNVNIRSHYSYIKYNDTNYMAWQHFGVALNSIQDGYHSQRVYNNSKVDSTLYFTNTLSTNKIDNRVSNRIFNSFPTPSEYYEANLDTLLSYKMPLVLPVKNTGIFSNLFNVKLQELKFRQLFSDPDSLTPADRHLRIANVIIIWNTIQHFFPYFDNIDVDWNAVLVRTIKDALNNRSDSEYLETLNGMLAPLQDGHTTIYYKNRKPFGNIPINCEWIQNEIVITATEDTLFKKGDIIKSIDGKNAKDELSEREKYMFGSPQLRRYRALITIGSGKIGSTAVFRVLRDSKEIMLERKREVLSKVNNYVNSINEFEYDGIKKLPNDIYYVNLRQIDVKELNDSINKLASSKGIIVDTRICSKYYRDNINVPTFEKIVPHLSESIYDFPKMLVPTVIYPDRINFVFRQIFSKTVAMSPVFKSKVIFITEPYLYSSFETQLSIIKENKLAYSVGAATGGTNGNVNYINLPGGFRVTFTGMKVLNHDRSQLYLVGIKPTYPVNRTIKAIKEGRDEYLEKAIEVINKRTNNITYLSADKEKFDSSTRY